MQAAFIADHDVELKALSYKAMHGGDFTSWKRPAWTACRTACDLPTAQPDLAAHWTACITQETGLLQQQQRGVPCGCLSPYAVPGTVYQPKIQTSHHTTHVGQKTQVTAHTEPAKSRIHLVTLPQHIPGAIPHTETARSSDTVVSPSLHQCRSY